MKGFRVPYSKETKKLKQPQNTQSFKQFCISLGVPFNNPTWSWCGYSKERNRAIFTVWEHELDGNRYVLVPNGPHPEQDKNGAREMRKIVDSLLSGQVSQAEVLGIRIHPKDVNALNWERGPYDQEHVLSLRLAEENGEVVAYVLGEVPTQDALDGPVTIALPIPDPIDDLKATLLGTESPDRVSGTTSGFRRDDRVRGYVIRRANGLCEYCGDPGFLMKAGRYLEAHHIIGLANEGPDTLANVIAVCANHHREAHYGLKAVELEREFVARLVHLGFRKSDALNYVVQTDIEAQLTC